MDIDDILEKAEFKNLKDYLEKEIDSTAGKDLVEFMYLVLGDKNSSKNWYFSKLLALGNKRPYDFCKDGKNEEVKNLLGRIEHGVYS
jgi:hypothetical protein